MKRLSAAFALSLLAAGSAFAQGADSTLREIEIIGKVQKPEVTLLITRQNLDTGYDLKLRESFVPRIAESLTRGPF